MTTKDIQYVALDLEFNQPSRKIIQVGVAIGSPMQSQEEWVCKQWLLDPGEPVAEHIVELTGISDEEIAQKAVAWPQMADELSTLLRQTKAFVNPITWGGGDHEALIEAIKAQGIAWPHFGRRWLDVKTMHAFLAMARGKNTSGGLRSVMGQYKLAFEGRQHRADHDAFNTLRLFFAMLERQDTLEAMAVLGKRV